MYVSNLSNQLGALNDFLSPHNRHNLIKGSLLQSSCFIPPLEKIQERQASIDLGF